MSCLGAKLRVEPMHRAFHEYHVMVREREIGLPRVTEFDQVKASRFVESTLLGISPLPLVLERDSGRTPIYLVARHRRDFEAHLKFVDGEYPLATPFNNVGRMIHGATFQDLPRYLQRRILEMVWPCQVFEAQGLNDGEWYDLVTRFQHFTVE